MAVDLSKLSNAELEALLKETEKGIKNARNSPAKKKAEDDRRYALLRATGGFAGKSLIDYIREDLGDVIGEYEALLSNSESVEYLDGLIDGICHALGTLRQNSGEDERVWAEAEYREKQRREETTAKTEEENRDVDLQHVGRSVGEPTTLAD